MKFRTDRFCVWGTTLVLLFALSAASAISGAFADEKAAKDFKEVFQRYSLSNKDSDAASVDSNSTDAENDVVIDPAEPNDEPMNVAAESEDPAGLADPPADSDADSENATEVAVENAADVRVVRKRFAVIFAQTHTYDYLTDTTKEDEKLYSATYGSMTSCYAAVVDSKYFDECVVLAGKRLIKENIVALFDKLRDESQEGDEIFIYWNGHGATGLPDDSDEERDGVDEYLALYETTNMLYSGDWAKSLRETALVDDELGKLFRSLPGRKITAIFETCHSGGLASPPRQLPDEDERQIKIQPGERIRATDLASFAAKSTADVKKNVSTYERSLRRELGKIGSDYVEALPYGASGAAASATRPRRSNSTPARSRAQRTNDSGSEDFSRWFQSRFSNGAKQLDGDVVVPGDIDSSGPYNLFFSSQEQEKCYGFTNVRGSNDESARVSINPVLLAFILSLRKAESANVPLRFEDFARVATNVVEINVLLLREEGLLDSFKTQTPVYYNNLPDVFMYAPDVLR